MEPIHSHDMEVCVDESSKQLNSPYLNGIYGHPEAFPRVGDQYQADIPEYDRLNLTRCFESQPPHLHNLVTFALPIPLMWTRSEKFRGFSQPESEKGTSPSTHQPSEIAEPAATLKPRSIVLALPCQRNAKFKFDWLDKSLYPFPGSLGESWDDAEQERFLLGLYCLGKNLVLVQRFLGTKLMGDMLSYYYGSFYRSSEYQRWVDGRKLRSRRSVQGQKLLSGWRQQELLSRISSHVSDECKTTLLKVSKAFRENKISLEDYVFTLKNTVGSDMLTEVIGIGKGKRDLTNCTLEPTKSNHGTSGNSEVQIRNDLPVADIVKFLTGEYRMSKTRSSDLFWEAVWPRLLARGWHSEQPKDGPKNSLVFLIPEVKKFSRRKMSKGNHYFDSLTDVLKKVALDPKLLELKTDEDLEKKVGKEEDIKNDPPINLEEFDDSSPNSKKKKRYLQPRSKTSKIQEVVMFTIVDTSEANGVVGSTLKELRSLPIETGSSIANSPDYLSESEDNMSEESENKAETTAKSMASIVCGGGSMSSGKSSSVNMDNATSRSTISLNERQQKNRKGGRPRNPKLPVCAKRSSLADCTLRESGCFGETQSRKKKPVKKGKQMRPTPLGADLNVHLMREEHIDQDRSLKLSSTSSVATDSSCQGNEDREISPERSETREDFDLNVSQISQERDADCTDTVITDVMQNSESSCAEQEQCNPQELQATADLLPGRRQSTRTRPLTTKALEAFAFGYLGNSKKRKASEESRSKSRKKSKKRSHRCSLVSSEFRNGTVEDGSNTDESE
ncbi:hypothetical protein CARUB_v10025005mg [Capsella rubella]|uniref:Uncharacterized protein n=2 Tax=Capsella rubella TaxID=81985 RepID=R0HXF4_9BRAS|nr:uncharacterized protein LOC17888539 isoform X2 [Capsella rubella]XP_023639719.1 uncharacterized protein LOC17888539 isoform X2 [Capsella rubella]EOA28773.1 hypothetical protein CARUB_v10025005mg [Capsella rubella]